MQEQRLITCRFLHLLEIWRRDGFTCRNKYQLGRWPRRRLSASDQEHAEKPSRQQLVKWGCALSHSSLVGLLWLPSVSTFWFCDLSSGNLVLQSLQRNWTSISGCLLYRPAVLFLHWGLSFIWKLLPRNASLDGAWLDALSSFVLQTGCSYQENLYVNLCFVWIQFRDI